MSENYGYFGSLFFRTIDICDIDYDVLRLVEFPKDLIVLATMAHKGLSASF